MSAFDPARVVLTFGALTDLHNSIHVPAALRFLQSHAPSGLDAVVHCGDMTDGVVYYNNLGEVETVRRVYERETPETLRWFFCLGNHDSDGGSRTPLFYDTLGPRFYGGDLTEGEFVRRTGYRHAVIKGFHFFALEGFFKGASSWYDPEVLERFTREIADAAAEDPLRPLFVVTHAPVKDTVFGCNCNGSADLIPILSQYPQTIVLTGHSHNALYREDSLWQGDFTVLNLGSVSYMAMPNEYLDIKGPYQLVYNCYDIPLGAMIEVDADRNVRISRYNFETGWTVGEPWDIPAPTADKAHLTAAKRLRSAAKAPVFTDKAVTTFVRGGDLLEVHHPAAISEGGRTLAYRYRVVKDGEVVFDRQRTSNFWNYATAAEMPDRLSVTLPVPVLPPYTLEISGFNAWNDEGEALSVAVPAASPAREAIAANEMEALSLLTEPSRGITAFGEGVVVSCNGTARFSNAKEGDFALFDVDAPLDGLHIRLRVRGAGALTLLLDTPGTAPGYDIGAANFRLELDTGRIICRPHPPTVVLESPMLSRAAAEDEPFDLHVFYVPEDLAYHLTLTTAWGHVEGVITTCCFNCADRLTDRGHVRLAVAAGKDGTDAAVTLQSFHKEAL